MPSIFPELFNFSYVAPFVLRVAISIVLAYLGYLAIFKNEDKNKKIIGLLQMISAVFFFFGLFTQIASILVMITTSLDAIISKIKNIPFGRKSLKFIILVIAISLMLSGPGIFSLDMPL